MRSSRLTQVLLFFVGLLLAANLLQPLTEAEPAYAQTASGGGLTGSGSTAWVVKGSQVYYLKFEQQFESIRIYGPEEIEE